jgi:predicted amidophosphoribosyltransferase
MRRLILAHKEHQVLTLTPFLAQRLAVAVDRLAEECSVGPFPLVLVPVPSTPAAVRTRGFDATMAMARLAARAGPGGNGCSARRLLSHGRRVQDQAGLSAADRHANLAGSLRATGVRPAPGTLVVIVDDLVTTGASLTEAARALRAAKIPVLGAATVAATVRSHLDRSA